MNLIRMRDTFDRIDHETLQRVKCGYGFEVTVFCGHKITVPVGIIQSLFEESKLTEDSKARIEEAKHKPCPDCLAGKE